MINVIIATANRPQLLKTALTSLRAQTAKAKINSVLISENGGNRASEAVCGAFPDLPIRYIYRDPPLSVLDHFYTLYAKDASDEFAALLHDDDWWAPDHLEKSLVAFADHPDSVAGCSGHFIVEGEASPLSCTHNFPCWFGANYPSHQETWELSNEKMILASLITTAAHLSTVVTRTAALRTAAAVFQLNNPFDVDRMLLVALGQLGSITYRPIPTVFVRTHQHQDTNNFKAEIQNRHKCDTTDWIIKTSGKNPAVLIREFKERAESCPKDARPLLGFIMIMPHVAPTLLKHSPQDPELEKYLPTPPPVSRSKRLLKQSIPPFVWDGLKSIKGIRL